ncbi:MAG: carbohydrate ABC transporter permease [Burkholderiales bacterium]|jgi:multiple sugar transport system permease protein/raffinose/stachyose/melibiose transport system permease protein
MLTARRVAPSDNALRTPWAAISGFLLPALVIYAAFTAYPVLRTFWNALHKVLPNGNEAWVGLANLHAILTRDPTFWKAVGNTLTWALVAPLIEVSLGLLLALALYARVPFARFFRVAWFTPVLISYVVVGILWVWIYNYDWGAANALLRFAGLEAWVRPWLGDPATALPALIFITTWMWTGFNMVVLLAALSSLPSEVLEAAELDNCGWGGKLGFVIVPLIRPTILNLVVLSFIGKMKIFDLVWITTQGGPLWSTETVSTYVYKRAFEWSTFDLGYPSAIASIWFVFVLAGVLILTWLFRSRERLEY